MLSVVKRRSSPTMVAFIMPTLTLNVSRRNRLSKLQYSPPVDKLNHTWKSLAGQRRQLDARCRMLGAPEQCIPSPNRSIHQFQLNCFTANNVLTITIEETKPFTFFPGALHLWCLEVGKDETASTSLIIMPS